MDLQTPLPLSFGHWEKPQGKLQDKGIVQMIYLDLLYLLLPPLLLHPLLSLLKNQCNELLFYTRVFYPLQGAAGQSFPVARADGLLWNSCPGPAAHPALLP